VVLITGVGGCTAANGIWAVTVTGDNTFTLDGSVGNSAYTSGGCWLTYTPAAITGASNAAPIEISSAGHGLLTGAVVGIRYVTGNTAANGVWTITRTGADTFTLDTSTGNGAYAGAGDYLSDTPAWLSIFPDGSANKAVTPMGESAAIVTTFRSGTLARNSLVRVDVIQAGGALGVTIELRGRVITIP
jgi:hypothetical protein